MGINRFIIRAGAVCCAVRDSAWRRPRRRAAHGGGHGGHGGSGKVRVLAEGLSSPKGVATNGTATPSSRRARSVRPGRCSCSRSGPDRGDSFPVTDPVNLTDVAISPKDDTGWGIGPGEDEHVYLYHQLSDGTIETVLDITAYQVTDPDPTDQDDFPEESNPYGLTVDRRGNALVADAANNDLLKVTPSGHAKTVARFDLETVKTDHLRRSSAACPPKITAEAVPTTVTIGPDGAIYVGELKGFPFRPGHLEGLAHRPARQRRALLGEHAEPRLQGVRPRASPASRTSPSARGPQALRARAGQGRRARLRGRLRDGRVPARRAAQGRAGTAAPRWPPGSCRSPAGSRSAATASCTPPTACSATVACCASADLDTDGWDPVPPGPSRRCHTPRLASPP